MSKKKFCPVFKIESSEKLSFDIKDIDALKYFLDNINKDSKEIIRKSKEKEIEVIRTFKPIP